MCVLGRAQYMEMWSRYAGRGRPNIYSSTGLGTKARQREKEAARGEEEAGRKSRKTGNNWELGNCWGKNIEIENSAKNPFLSNS